MMRPCIILDHYKSPVIIWAPTEEVYLSPISDYGNLGPGGQIYGSYSDEEESEKFSERMLEYTNKYKQKTK